MNKVDEVFKDLIQEIIDEGVWDENPRPVYESDGEPAYTKYITMVNEEYDLSKGEFPLTTLRPIAVTTGINEMLAFYQTQTNTEEGFLDHNVGFWKQWVNDKGNIGRAYAHNLESHRPNEMRRNIVSVDVKKTSSNPIYVFTLGSYKNVPNFSDKHIERLQVYWLGILEECNYESWCNFELFLRDVKNLPQYHLAKEDDFENWVLSKSYYKSNHFNPETAVWLTERDEVAYTSKSPKGEVETVLRYELSRNQVNELIHDLKYNKYSRRHMTSFYNWANQDKKELVECAFQTLWSVRNVKGEMYLDLTLVQRSSDFLVAGHINMCQYVAFQMMIAHECGYKLGKFGRYTQNLHIYDRHIEQAHELLKRKGSNKQPRIVLNAKGKSFYEITIDDFEVVDYEPQKPQLTFELGI